MQFIKHKKHWLIMIAIFINLFFISLLTHPLPTHASEAGSDVNGTQEDTDDDLISGGSVDPHVAEIFKDNTMVNGWLVYMMDSNGQELLEYGLVYAIGTGTPQGSVDKVLTRYAHRNSPTKFKSAPWSPQAPFTIAGGEEYHGEKVKEWLKKTGFSYQGRTLTNACKVVLDFFGPEALETYIEEWEDTYLVLDVVASTPIVMSRNRAVVVSGTAYGFGTQGIGEYGNLEGVLSVEDAQFYRDYDSSWITNRCIPKSARLDRDWTGLAGVPPIRYDGNGRVSNSDMAAYGWGELAIRGMEPAGIHTYTEEHGSPGDPEYPDDYDPPHDGTSRIVKTYYTYDTVEEKIVGTGNDRTTFSLDTSPLIYIDEEPKEYHIEKWKSSSNTNTGGITAFNWDSATGSAINEGTSGATIELDEKNLGEKTVYVLLRRDIGDEEEIAEDYVLNQSEIMLLPIFLDLYLPWLPVTELTNIMTLS